MINLNWYYLFIYFPTPVFLPGEFRDGWAWWAAVYGVAQSQTRLKRLSSSSSIHIFHILKEINPEYSLEGLRQKLKFQYSDHLMRRANSLEKTWSWERLKAKEKGRGGQRIRWLDSITNSMDMNLKKLQEWKTGKPGMLPSMGSQRV